MSFTFGYKMKTHAIIVAAFAGICGTLCADPSEFLRDGKDFRHGTYDRIWMIQTVYVDRDGSIYLPFKAGLQKANEAAFSLYIKSLEDTSKAMADAGKARVVRVLVHPEAQWKNLQKLVLVCSNRKLDVQWKVAELKPKR